jgi:hypothetical protein
MLKQSVGEEGIGPVGGYRPTASDAPRPVIPSHVLKMAAISFE